MPVNGHVGHARHPGPGFDGIHFADTRLAPQGVAEFGSQKAGCVQVFSRNGQTCCSIRILFGDEPLHRDARVNDQRDGGSVPEVPIFAD